MSRDIIITCAVTGAGDTVGRHPAIPVTPEQIATSALEAARAGVAIVHIHVRDPETGKPSRELIYYREVVERIRRSGVDVIINLTGGPGANYFPSAENSAVGGRGRAPRCPTLSSALGTFRSYGRVPSMWRA